MTEPKKSRVVLNDVLERIARLEGAKNDAAIARALETSPQTLATQKKRGTVPYEKLCEYAVRRGVDLDWLLLGHQQEPFGLELPRLPQFGVVSDFLRGGRDGYAGTVAEVLITDKSIVGILDFLAQIERQPGTEDADAQRAIGVLKSWIRRQTERAIQSQELGDMLPFDALAEVPLSANAAAFLPGLRVTRERVSRSWQLDSPQTEDEPDPRQDIGRPSANPPGAGQGEDD